ncbi:MAG: hypothetical protein AB7S38_29960 [Vulcanimicrobiota bacterium]
MTWRRLALCLLLWAHGWAEPVLTGGALVDIRYGDLLLDTIDEGLNLDASGVSSGFLNGRVVPLEQLPRQRAAFVRWDDKTGRVLRIDVVDAAAERESVDGAADLWQVGLTSGGPFRQGQVLEVEMRASAGGRASFDVVGLAWGVEAIEVKPGIYRGRLTVKPGMDARQTYVLGRYERAGLSYPVRLGPRVSLAATPPVLLETGGGRTTVFARYRSLGTLVTGASLSVDGVELPSQATSEVVLGRGLALAPGLHQARVWLKDAAGNQVHYDWTFSVD